MSSLVSNDDESLNIDDQSNNDLDMMYQSVPLAVSLADAFDRDSTDDTK